MMRLWLLTCLHLLMHQQSPPLQLREILRSFLGLAYWPSYGPLGSQTDIHPKLSFTNPIEATCLAKGRLICLYRSLTGPLRSHSFRPDPSSSVNGWICAGASAAGGHIITSGTHNHSYLLSENIKSPSGICVLMQECEPAQAYDARFSMPCRIPLQGYQAIKR